MGKSCVRVKTLDDVPLDVVGKLFKRVKAKDFVASYEASLSGGTTKKPAGKKKASQKPAGKKKTAKKKRATASR